MLRELAKLSGGMLFMHGHVANIETARRLDHGHARHAAKPAQPASRKRRLPGAAEWLMLAPIWIATPVIVFLAIAELVHPT